MMTLMQNSPQDLYPGKPVVSWLQAGSWQECADPYPPGVADEWVQPTQRVSKSAFALRVKGNSMEPEFTEGDTIIVDPEREALHANFVVVKLEDAQEATFKQLIIDGGQKFLRPLNAHYPVMAINGNATIVGVVVAKMKNY